MVTTRTVSYTVLPYRRTTIITTSTTSTTTIQIRTFGGKFRYHDGHGTFEGQ